MNDEIMSKEEFDIKFRETIHKLYPQQIKDGKIFETETCWHGINLKNKSDDEDEK